MKQGGLDDAVKAVRQFVYTKVAAGYRALDDIAEEAVEIGALDAPADEVRPLVPSILEDCVRQHAAEQDTWPEETDCDRLSSAFEQLERQGVLARQDFSCCGNCGVGEIWQEIESCQANAREVRGYTFFHMQDTDAAVDGEGLYLSYGSVEDSVDAAVDIGHEVVATLQAHGLRCRWDGTIENRLFVSLDWKHRR